MTVEFWTSAERFYELWIFLLALLLLLLVIALIFIFSYSSKANRKKRVFLVLGLMTLLGGIGLSRHLEYRPYLEQARYTNPLIRDRTPRLHMYQYYSETEMVQYAKLNGIDSLREMALYEEVPIIESLNYLGHDENFYYFEQSDGQLFKQTLQVKFSENVPQAQLIGSRFLLKDEAFKEIGFLNPEQIMYASIEIPADERDKIFEADKNLFIPRVENMLFHWNF